LLHISYIYPETKGCGDSRETFRIDWKHAVCAGKLPEAISDRINMEREMASYINRVHKVAQYESESCYYHRYYLAEITKVREI
jgi:hypothetical protein